MAKVYYSDEDKQEFINAAQELGVGPAMRKLGFPGSWATAQKWHEIAGVEMPTIDSIQSKAASMKQFYGDKEKLVAAQAVIERIVEEAQNNPDLTADDINKLSNALQKNIQTFNLIEGKATSVSETHSKDASDLAIMDLIGKQKAKNALIEQEQDSIPAE